MATRYITTSERSVHLAEGAHLYAKTQDAVINSRAEILALRAWGEWCGRWGTSDEGLMMIGAAKKIQAHIFDQAQRF